MLKQVPAKCPRRRICSGTPLQGPMRCAGRPTPHTLSFVASFSSTLFQTIQTCRLFSRPVIQIAFLRMAIRTNSSGLRDSTMKSVMQIVCVAYLDTFCTLELTKCGRRAFESGVGHKNQIYFYPIFPCTPIVEFTESYSVYAIPISVCTIQYSYSRGAHGNIKSDSRVWNLFSRACHIPVLHTGINWIPVAGIRSFS